MYLMPHHLCFLPLPSLSRCDPRAVLAQDGVQQGRVTLQCATGITNWTLQDIPDLHRLYQSVIELYGIEDIPVMVPNVRDAAGVLIHPSEYSQKITGAVPVVQKAEGSPDCTQLDFWSRREAFEWFSSSSDRSGAAFTLYICVFPSMIHGGGASTLMAVICAVSTVFSPHPANLLGNDDATAAPHSVISMVEKMGVSDPESVKAQPRHQVHFIWQRNESGNVLHLRLYYKDVMHNERGNRFTLRVKFVHE
ncbi:hypothetical protein DFJ58DRAFT_912634 [Suillus subalutaceus]|uniref:uncharacterized protein n=1 Tax=Suillus subalutaceus TaxID=48586 RepID=UPI001B86D3E4|nr:uncharacterized protein DFJ58DRAFT_912634 [Suillus subalutaceus]KAG1862067.1 hypothetical protein DFJ58DRAFT_912634 [Suillus subalutaceus]